MMMMSIFNFSKKKDATIDKLYGVQEKPDGRFMIGNLPISFTSDYITVGNKKYERSIGLTELILLKNPPDSTKTEKENYKKY